MYYFGVKITVCNFNVVVITARHVLLSGIATVEVIM